MNSLTPSEIYFAYLKAFEERDFETARYYLADRGFISQSPIGRFDDADTFIEYAARTGPILEGIDRLRTFAEGNEVCCILNYKTRLSELEVTPVVQWVVVKDGKIVSIKSFFDAYDFKKMFEE